MKFSCERCKTRYSIADERVRGKVLKIRCKNCEFVISVREGMDEAAELPPASATAARVSRPTTMAPSSGPSEAPPAPPPQLEDEWYVSIDGQQSGPFVLADAQAWVAKHPFAADLHCWSEGFDDWLPVEKVSQLRGLRVELKPAPPKGPPPRPKIPPAAEVAVPPFAAAAAVPGATLHAEDSASPAAGALPVHAARNAEAVEDPFAKLNAYGRDTASSDAFAGPIEDNSDDGDDDLSIGEVSRVVNLADLMKQPRSRSAPVATTQGGPARIGSAAKIGVRTSSNGITSLANGTAPVVLQPADAVTAGLALAAQEAQADALADVAMAGAPLAVHIAPLPKRSHVGLLLVGGLAIVGIAILVLVASGVFSREDQDGPRIAVDEYDNLGNRKDQVFRPGSSAPVLPGSAAEGSGKVIKPSGNSGNVKNPNTTSNTPNTNPNNGSGKVETVGVNGPVLELKADDVENMFQRNSDISRRCYEQALKKDPFLEVKKIAVTMSVDKAGMVNDVNLSSHADHQLGKCLIQRIKAWRFRESSGGITTRINVVFGS